MTAHDTPRPLRADVYDRTGRHLEITAGIRPGEVLVALGRPGHRPLAEFAITLEQFYDIGDVIETLRQTVASQS